MLPIKFRVNWPFGSKVEAKNRFSRWPPWGPSWASDWNDLIFLIFFIFFFFFFFFFYLHVTLMIRTMFQDNWPFCSGEEAKTIFQDGGNDGHHGFSIGTISASLIYKSPRYFQSSFESIG